MSARIARHQTRTTKDPPAFDAVVDESVLHRVVGSPAVMLEQLLKLREVSVLPNVSFRVIPYEAGLPPALNAKFIVLHFALPTIPDVIYIELLTHDTYVEDPEDVERYKDIFTALSAVAATPEETRAILDRKIAYYSERAR